MSAVNIAIDPSLTQQFGPEIHWAFRTLLTGIGWRWKEVSLSDPCDIAYTIHPDDAPLARLCITADKVLWERPSDYRLEQIILDDDLQYLKFKGRHGQDGLLTQHPRTVLSHDLVFDYYWLLTGQEEQHWPKDSHGFYDLGGTKYLQSGALVKALASGIGTWVERKLISLGSEKPIARWPGGCQIAVGVGHDVDYPEVKRLIEPLRILSRMGLNGVMPAIEVFLGMKHHWHFSSWIALEKSLGVHSAFYFVPRKGSLREYAGGLPDPFYDVTSPRFRNLFTELKVAGKEIGMHASYLAYQSTDKFSREKNRLEQVCGCQVSGNRHHYWHLNPGDIESTLLMHEEIGFVYDSSLIHDRYLGWRRGSSWPFFPFHHTLRRQIKTLQVPVCWMDDQLFSQHHFQPGDRDEQLGNLASIAAQQGGCVLIDIHDYVFDPVLFPNWTRTFSIFCELLASKYQAWFATPIQIANHWIDRHEMLVSTSSGLTEGQ